MKKKKTFLFLAKVSLAIFFLIYLFSTDKLDFGKVSFAFQKWHLVAGAFAGFGLAICITIQRWRLLLLSQGISLGYFKALKLSFIGFFFNIFMPGSVGGDFIKAFYIARKQEEKRTEAVFSVFLDRVIGLFSLILLAAIAIGTNFFFFWEKEAFRLFIIFVFSVTFVMVTVGLLLLMAWIKIPKSLREKVNPHSSNWIKRIFSQLYFALSHYQKNPKHLFQAIGLSLLVHSINISMFYFLALALGEFRFDLQTIFALTPIGMVAQAIPISFGAWGWGEFAFQSIFDSVLKGGVKSQGANICLLWHLLITSWNLMGIIFYLEEKAEVDRLIKIEEQKEEALTAQDKAREEESPSEDKENSNSNSNSKTT